MLLKQSRPDINVTPLVDVVLVLLIIFMVVTPQMEAGATVELPGMLHPDPKNELKRGTILVSVSASGKLYLDKERLERDVLVEKLNELHAAEPQKRLMLKADRAVRYGEVRRLFKECQAIGFPGVSLQVGDRKGKRSE